MKHVHSGSPDWACGSYLDQIMTVQKPSIEKWPASLIPEYFGAQANRMEMFGSGSVAGLTVHIRPKLGLKITRLTPKLPFCSFTATLAWRPGLEDLILGSTWCRLCGDRRVQQKHPNERTHQGEWGEHGKRNQFIRGKGAVKVGWW